MDFLAGLNPQQQQAVAHVEGPLLILAGAGSGKTRVVTHRICHLVQDVGVRPESILAVTFTNKAAGEMRDRVGSLMGGLAMVRSPEVSTFHSFCVRMLRRDGAPLAKVRPGFTTRFVIYDEDDQLSLVKAIYRNIGVDDKSLPARQVLSRISTAKNRHDGPDELLRDARDPISKRVAQIFELYESGLRQNNALDFDDLLLESVRLLKSDDFTREAYSDRLQFLMIDEYQDTNRSQYELVRLLSSRHSNVCVVGDEDQSIYSWRGADIRNILDFEQDYPNATVIRLEQNYRSTKNILEAASTVIANNHERKGKTLWTDGAQGDKITVYQASDGENEALYIADEIQRWLKRGTGERIAVLYRTNSQSRQVEEALRRYNVQYVVVGGVSFYQRAEIKDVMAYLKLVALPTDSMSLLRIVNTPARGIGKTTIEQVEKHAAECGMSYLAAIGDLIDRGMLAGRAHAALVAFRAVIEDLQKLAQTEPLPRVIEEILDRTGYRKMLEADKSPESEARLENLAELLNAAAEAAERGEGLAEFLDHAALVAQTDQLNETAKVSLLTVHNAKGLEFPIVFLAGMEEGLFPHSRSRDNDAMLEEERRLCYVGMTRAEKRLTLSFAKARRKFGGGPLEPAIRSRFLLELPPAVIDEKGGSDPAWNDERYGISRYGEQRYGEQRYGSQGYGARWERGGSVARGPKPGAGEVDLYTEQHEVREAANKNLYTGKTYNSVENISEFFQSRGLNYKQQPEPVKPKPAGGLPIPPPLATPKSAQQQTSIRQPAPSGPKPLSPPVAGKPKEATSGAYVQHPKYGRGQVLRREGDGEDAKLTVMFPGHGIKKLFEKFAGLRVD